LLPVIFLSFLPWIAFSIAAHTTSFPVATALGFGLALVANVPNLIRRRPKLLDVAGAAFFFTLGVLALVLPELDWLGQWSGALGNGAIALIILLSIVSGVPFTLQYAREQVPAAVWQTAAFYSTCLTISWVWFAAMLVMTLGSVLGHVWTDMPVWLHWVIPIVTFTAAIRFTKWFPEHRKQVPPPGEA
jgi:hypothetical protein